MTTLTFKEFAAEGLQIGDSFTTSRSFRNEDLVRFAKTRNSKASACHGLLAASLVTELGGQIGWLASSMNLRFKGPVIVGETITCTLEIMAMDENGCAKATATIVKQGGGTVIKAEISGIVPGYKEGRMLRDMLSKGDPTNRQCPSEDKIDSGIDSNSAMSNSSRDQGSQGVARRRTIVRRTNERED